MLLEIPPKVVLFYRDNLNSYLPTLFHMSIQMSIDVKLYSHQKTLKNTIIKKTTKQLYNCFYDLIMQIKRIELFSNYTLLSNYINIEHNTYLCFTLFVNLYCMQRS